ncbi:MAG TPA: hypothetical protein VKB62_05105 [Streptosporangiaceae bacterium]|nr:hypothetical protein [Streptosporangiaceae bacterium]
MAVLLALVAGEAVVPAAVVEEAVFPAAARPAATRTTAANLRRSALPARDPVHAKRRARLPGKRAAECRAAAEG